jgi:hypothetical protein
MDETELLDLINRRTQEADRPYFTVMGNYLTQYAMLEMQLTMILAAQSNMVRDLESFHILTRGMDCRVKLERMRTIAKGREGIGPKLKMRLDHFEQKAIQLRNDLAHAAFWRNETVVGRYHLLTIDTARAADFDDQKIPEVARVVEASDLLQAAYWLNVLREDLSPVFFQAIRREQLEVVNPKSRVPKEDPVGQRRPKQRATPRKREQKQS